MNKNSDAMVAVMTKPGRLWRQTQPDWYDVGNVRLAVGADECDICVFDGFNLAYSLPVPASVPAAVAAALLEAVLKADEVDL